MYVASQNPRMEGTVAGTTRPQSYAARLSSLPPYDDIEMAMARHGVGKYGRDESIMSNEKELKPRAWAGSDSGGSGVEEKGRPEGRPQIPASVLLSTMKPIYEIEPNHRLLQIEQLVKQDVSKGIKIKTVVEV